MSVLKKCRFTRVRKRFCEKKMNNYRKANTELKIEIKKDAIQSNDGSIHLYEDEQKKFTGKAPKIEWKATRFSPKVKKGVSPLTRQWVARKSPDTVFESPESRHFGLFDVPTILLGFA
ncbi:hypothetical protein [Priestia megaterium]|uniref:hypothetical protein n=1 Tax=Priestia megaterium TaxID=1404 RepID=UPI00237C39DE|nr:hypothetical protein [Priestia megaterium]